MVLLAGTLQLPLVVWSAAGHSTTHLGARLVVGVLAFHPLRAGLVVLPWALRCCLDSRLDVGRHHVVVDGLQVVYGRTLSETRWHLVRLRGHGARGKASSLGLRLGVAIQRVKRLRLIHRYLHFLTFFSFVFGVTKFNLAFLFSALGLRPDVVNLFVEHFYLAPEIHV